MIVLAKIKEAATWVGATSLRELTALGGIP